MLLLLQHLRITVLSLVHAKGNKDDRSGQAVQDEASLTPAATREGVKLLDGAETPSWQCARTAVTALRQPSNPEMRMTAITREWLCWDDYWYKSERERKYYSRTNAVCSRSY